MLKGFVKLSELNNDDMLLVGENYVISKEDFIKEIHEHTGEEVCITKVYKASINAKDMLEDAIVCEADNMYEDWEDRIWEDIRDEDIAELQNVIDRILAGSRNISYIAYKRVEIDVK